MRNLVCLDDLGSQQDSQPGHCHLPGSRLIGTAWRQGRLTEDGPP